MLNYLFTFFLFFSSLNFFGQKLSYIQKDIKFTEIKNISTQNWIPIEKKLFNGINNGTYWLKIESINTKPPFIVSLNENKITNAELYTDSTTITPIKNTRKIEFLINSLKDKSPIYLKVNFKKEAILSLEINPIIEHYQKKTAEHIYHGIYYGIAILVLLINLHSYLNYRRKTYLHYIAMVSFLTLSFVCADGYVNIFFKNENIRFFAEHIFSIGVAFSLPVFANSYMNLKKHLPNINKYGIILVFINIVFFTLFLIKGDFYWFVLVEIFGVMLLTTYWFAGLAIYKKSVYAKIFTIAYFVINFSTYGYYLAKSFGIDSLNINLNQFRIGAIIEMFVFTYAINYQAKLLDIENQKMLKQLQKYSKTNEAEKLMNTDVIIETRMIHQFNLTPKELLILKAISQGKINKEIANDLNLSINTIKFHVKNIYRKLETSSRQETRQKYFSAI